MQSSKPVLQYSVSAISARPRFFFEALPLLEEGRINRIHVDVMDGRFVPRFGLFPEFVSDLREMCALPIDIHMMVENPEDYVSVFASAGATRIVPHIEPVQHLHRLVSKIRDEGIEVGLALNPHSELTALRYVVAELSVVTVMAINPGIISHKAIPNIKAKVAEARSFVEQESPGCLVEVDGGVTFHNLNDFVEAGADALVVGAGTIFNSSGTILDNLEKLNFLRSTPV